MPSVENASTTPMLDPIRIFCQALCPFWTKTDTKVTFHPPPATRKLFLVSYEKYGKNKNFLFQCYGTNFAPITRYCPFCFLCLNIRGHRFSLQDLCHLSVCLFCLSFFLSSFFVCLFKNEKEFFVLPLWIDLLMTLKNVLSCLQLLSYVVKQKTFLIL